MNIFSWFTGSVCIHIEGIAPEKLIGRLRPGVPMRKIQKTGTNGLQLYVMYRDRKKVEACARDICPNCTVTAEKARGLSVYFEKSRKRPGLYVGALAAFVLVYAAMGRVWDLRVEGNQTVEKADILETLEHLGVHEGMKKQTAELEYIYNSFLLAENRISWIAINYDGMIAHVEVKEAEPKRLADKRTCNIVAACDGIVRRLDVLDGHAEVPVGETVKKGELLISAFVPTRETGTVMRSARGSVWAQTVHTYEIHISKNVQRKHYGAQKQTGYTVCLLGKELRLYKNNRSSDSLYGKSYERQPYRLFDRMDMPFDLQTETLCPYTFTESAVTLSQAEERASKELARRTEDELADAEIVKRELTYRENGEEYVFLFELTCVENIARSVAFEFE